ncbi:hypothetical protein Aperf_G00000010284 [Anoplocephala perfoliata]
MPYDICEDDSTLDLIESEMASRGITQEDIDEKRRVPEREMLAAMEQLVRTGSDLNQLDGQGAAPLHIAAACGYLDVVGFLLQHGANIDLPDRDGWMAIHVAACWGQLKELTTPNSPSQVLACLEYEVIEMLTNFGAKLDTPTVNGGETVFDICEDEKLHERLVMLREELKRWQSFHLAQNQTSAPNGNGDLDSKSRGLSRRRSSNPRSSSIRRTSMRDKAKISWKEAQQEAETRSLVVSTADGDSVVEEIVKTPVWMTAVEDTNAGATVVRKSNSPKVISFPSSVEAQRRPVAPQPISLHPINSTQNLRSRTSSIGPSTKSNSGDPAIVVDGPRLHPAHKPPDSLARKRAHANESPPPRASARLSSRLADSMPPMPRSPNAAQPSSTYTPPMPTPTPPPIPPPPLPHQQTTSANGVSQSSNLHLHNAYYPVAPQTTATSSSSAPGTAAKTWLPSSHSRSPPPHVLISTGAKPMAGGTPGVIASPLQPGASLTRPPLKRDLLISDSRKGADQMSGNNSTSGKCCILM